VSAASSLATRRDGLAAAAGRFRRPLRDALIIVGLARAFVYFVIQGIHPWEFAGIDARAYWRIDLAHPYANSGVGELSTYLYSPAFAQVVAPLSLLPFELFFALWTAVSIALFVWLVRPWPWAIPMLILPISYELFVGNVHFLLAAAFVVGLRAPVAWALPVLTKITPGAGALWFLVRAEWRAFAIAVGSTVAIVAVSFVLAPSAWTDWVEFLLASPGRTELLLPRLALAAVLVVAGARTNRAWVIPIAGWLALPVIWVNSWVILLAVIRMWPRDTAAGPSEAGRAEVGEEGQWG
jgi:hypothetical protein